jgi:hypothetical protein
MAGDKSAEVSFRSVVTIAIDDVALSALRNRREPKATCSVCDGEIDGEPGGTGLLMWTRGEETRFDEPPICGDCARTLNVTAFARWTAEESEE